MNEKIKILFVIPNLQGGGAERVFVHLIRHIDREQFVPFLAIGSLEGAYLRYLPKDIPIYELNASRARKALIPLIRLVRRLRPDIVFSTLGLSVAVAMLRPFIPRDTLLIARSGNSISAYLKDVGRENIIKKIIYWLANVLIFKSSHCVIAQSNFMLQDALNTLPVDKKKIKTIYNPVDISYILKIVGDLKPSFHGSGPHLVAVGRLHWQKGYDILLKALPNVCKLYPEGTLTILGEGEERLHLESLAIELKIENNIRFLGFVDNPYPYIQKADMLVLSSRYEGFANVLLESLALGTPVIATDCPGGNREVITDGVNGWLSPNEYPAGLSDVILKALNNLEAIDSKAMMYDISKRFNVGTICKEYEKIFLETINQ
ncbi:glycosyltransferase [Desulfococcaceae bacterium HSG9]|nr:glycosyltransferase [Desulfococcaceae bacterium HSG9]